MVLYKYHITYIVIGFLFLHFQMFVSKFNKHVVGFSKHELQILYKESLIIYTIYIINFILTHIIFLGLT